jgi:nucleotidyltransferase/DNA polymerase involved in DNA repair
MIVCLRIPNFAAAVEQCENVQLAGAPFALVEVQKAVQVVYAVSSAAVLEGVRTGMTLREAQTSCPVLQLLPANPARYHRIASDISETLATFTPLVEQEIAPSRIVRGRHRPQPSIQDEGAAIWFLNPGRMTRTQGSDFARNIHDSLFETAHLTAAVGLAANRFTARVAASSLKPGETTLVPRETERDFLARYPVGLLPIFPEQARQLRLLGIRTLGGLASVPVSALGDLFGGQGKTFKRLAEGRDSTPVREYTPLIAERAIHQFDSPVEDRTILQNVLAALVEVLVARMEERHQMAGEVALSIMFSGGKTRIEEMALRQPSASAAHLTQALKDLLDVMRFGSSVIEIEVSLGAIVEAEARQLSLFAPESIPQDRLRSVLRQLILRHGTETFYWAHLTNPDARFPEQRFELQLVKAA